VFSCRFAPTRREAPLREPVLALEKDQVENRARGEDRIAKKGFLPSNAYIARTGKIEKKKKILRKDRKNSALTRALKSMWSTYCSKKSFSVQSREKIFKRKIFQKARTRSRERTPFILGGRKKQTHKLSKKLPSYIEGSILTLQVVLGRLNRHRKKKNFTG